MTICFRDKGVYAVHVKEDFDLFLDAVEKLGIDVSPYKGKEYIWPQMTCLFAVDTNQMILDYLPQPSICAAIASSGVKIWPVDEFKEEVCCIKLGDNSWSETS